MLTNPQGVHGCQARHLSCSDISSCELAINLWQKVGVSLPEFSLAHGPKVVDSIVNIKVNDTIKQVY